MLFCLQKKIFEIERCKDISMKIEKNEFDEGKILILLIKLKNITNKKSCLLSKT